MKELKPPPVNLDAVANQGGGGCGCMFGGCAIAFLLLMFFCVGSYYGLMHTSLPLTMIERGLEEDGKIRIDGLRGSISKGFEIDKLEFEGYGGQWSELRGVKFQFNGIYDLASNERFVIEQATVESGTIYAELEEAEDFEPGMEADWGEGFAEGLDEVHREFEEEEVQGLEEVRIDLMRVKDLKIINPDTELTLEIEYAEFKDFQMIEGQITNLGHIEVKSDHLDLDSKPSERYDGGKLSWRLDGQLKKETHTKLLADIPFEIDLVIRDNNQVESFIDLFEGKLTMERTPDGKNVVVLSDLSPSDYYVSGNGLSATQWNLRTTTTKKEEWVEEVPVAAAANSPDEEDSPDENEMSDDESGQVVRDAPKTIRRLVTTYTMEIEPGSSFVLGETRFDIQTETATYEYGRGAIQLPEIVATTESDDSLTARLQFKDRSPFVVIELESSDGRDPEDIWAQLFFGKPYSEISPDEQEMVDRTLQRHDEGEPAGEFNDQAAESAEDQDSSTATDESDQP